MNGHNTQVNGEPQWVPPSAEIAQRFETESGMTTAQLEEAYRRGDTKGCSFLEKAAMQIKEKNPALFAQFERMAKARALGMQRGGNSFPWSR